MPCVETCIQSLGEASLGWGIMPRLKKGNKQGKSNVVAGRSMCPGWVLLTKFTFHAASWKHHRPKSSNWWYLLSNNHQSAPVFSQTQLNFMGFERWEFPRVSATSSAMKVFGLKYFDSRLPEFHFNCGISVLNPSKFLFSKTTFCYAQRWKCMLKEAWET